MTDFFDSVKNRCIRAILEVNDLGVDPKQKSAMRAIVMTAVNTAFHEVRNASNNKQTGVSSGKRTTQHRSKNR